MTARLLENGWRALRKMTGRSRRSESGMPGRRGTSVPSASAERGLLRGQQQDGSGHHLVHEAGPERPRRLQAAAGQDQVEAPGQADRAAAAAACRPRPGAGPASPRAGRAPSWDRRWRRGSGRRGPARDRRPGTSRGSPPPPGWAAPPAGRAAPGRCARASRPRARSGSARKSLMSAPAMKLSGLPLRDHHRLQRAVASPPRSGAPGTPPACPRPSMLTFSPGTSRVSDQDARRVALAGKGRALTATTPVLAQPCDLVRARSRPRSGPPRCAGPAPARAVASKPESPRSRSGRRDGAQLQPSPPRVLRRRPPGLDLSLPKRFRHVQHRLHAGVRRRAAPPPTRRGRGSRRHRARLCESSSPEPAALPLPPDAARCRPSARHRALPELRLQRPHRQVPAVAAAVDVVAGVAAGQLVDAGRAGQRCAPRARVMSARMPSSIETSTCCPRPVRSRACSAARMPIAARRPPGHVRDLRAGQHRPPVPVAQSSPRRPPRAR